MKNIVEGEEEESDGTEFFDSVFLDEEDSYDRIKPESHKDKPNEINDDDDHDDHALIKTRRTGSSKVRTEKMQTPIPSPPRSPRKDLSLDKAITEEMTIFNTVLNVHSTTSASTATITSDLQEQLYLKMKSNLQAQVDNAFRKHDHDDHQGDDAPLEGEKSAKRKKKSKSSKSASGSSSKQLVKDTNTLASGQQQQQDLDAWVHDPVIDEDEEAWLSIQHWKDTWHKRMYKINHRKVRNDPEEYFSDHKIVEVVKIITKQQHELDFMEQIIMMRENDKPSSFFEADFKYLNKNDIEDIYRIKINLTASTLIFPGIEACNPYSIVDEPTTSLIYLNIKEEKRVMDLIDIAKFCYATLEKVLKAVKIKIFEIGFMKKAPLLR
ncbi:hypothetical protein Tco_1568142 [Tanacetum coccineum]